MGTTLVLSFLIVVCGFIAYTGDLLGRRLGKRRLSAFGLRPRHTAVLCTAITGMVIAGTMVGVLMGASAGVRMAILRGEALLRQNRQYRMEADDLLGQKGRLEAEIKRKQGDNDRLALRNDAIEAQNARIERENTRLAQKNESLTGQVERLDRSSQQLRVDVQALRASRDQLAGENRRLATDNRTALRQLAARRTEIERTRRKLADTRLQLAAAKRDLATNRRALASNKELLASNLKEWRDRDTRVKELEFEEQRLNRDVASLKYDVDRLALSKVVVSDQDELARLTVAAGTPADEVAAQVRQLLAHARQVAWEKGARPDNKHQGAVYLVNGRMARALGTTVDWPDVERDLVQWIVGRVVETGEDVVLRAKAERNTAKGQPVPVDVKIDPNVIAFRHGEEIAATTLSPSQTRGQMLEQLQALLQTQVRNASLARQVIPGARNELGEVRYDPLLEVADKVKRLGVAAKVGAVAARDIRSADPLVVDFYVVPAETPVAALSDRVADDGR